MSRSTLLLITRDQLARADFRTGRAPRLVELRQDCAPPVDDVPSLVEAALRLSPRRPGRVWVLCSECWTQSLSLAAESVANLAPPEIAKALGFEAEPFSGISGLEAGVGYVNLPSTRHERTCWLTLLPLAQLDQLDYVIRAAGGRLAGVCHPGGLPRVLAPPMSAGGSWSRVELWPGAILCLHGEAHQPPCLRVMNIDPKPGRWELEVQRWRDALPAVAHAEMLHATPAVAAENRVAGSGLTLEDPGHIQLLLAAWLVELGNRQPRVPRVPPPQRAASSAARWAAATALAASAVLCCAAHHVWTAGQQRELSAETQRLRKPAAQLAALRQETERLQKARDALQQQCDTLEADLQQVRVVRDSLRRRLAVLLSVLAAPSRDEWIIQRIASSGEGLVLRGTCLHPRAADSLCGRLSKSLLPLGWHVHLPQKHAQGLLAEGGPWQFEISIQEATHDLSPLPTTYAASRDLPES